MYFCDRLFKYYSELSGDSMKLIQGKKALIVDDNKMNLKLLDSLLRECGYHSVWSLNGEDALKQVLECEFDIIFMDHMMPDYDGIETTNDIRQLRGQYYQKIPIIALTTNSFVGTRDMFLQCGFNDAMAKPVTLQEVKEMLFRWC